MRPRRLALLLALAGVVVLSAIGGWALVAGLGARDDLLRVRAVVEEQRSREADPLELRSALLPAAEDAARARRRLSQPGPALVARLPVLGRSLAAERDVAIAADVLLGVAVDVLERGDRLQVEGGVDVTVLRAVGDDLAEAGRALQGPLSRLEAMSLDLVPGSVREAVVEIRRELAGVDADLTTWGRAVDTGASLLGADGPRDLVLVLMNNAELRGAGGYGGSFAQVRADAGRVSVGPFQDVNEVQEAPEGARRVPAPADYVSRWGPFLANSTLWKNTLMSADQPTSAAVTCRVVRLAPGLPCDGVVLVDVPALARLVDLTGPVDLGGGEQIGGSALVEALLVEAYAETADTVGAQAERRRRLRAAADAAISGLLEQGASGTDLLRTLVGASRGRHLALWSDRPDEQATLTAAGLDGGVTPTADDLNLVSVNQLSAGKLDYYVDRSVGLLAVVDETEAQVTQKVSLALDAPAGLPRYVLGVRDGRLEELMDIAVPLAAQDVVLKKDGEPVPVVIAEETGSLRVVNEVVLRAGESSTWEVSYRLPVEDGRYRLQLLPQPLARDAVLHLAVVPAEGARLRDGEVRYDGPYDVARRVEVQATR